MTIESAVEIVLDLARGNALDPDDPYLKHEEGLRRQAETQHEAIDIVDKLFQRKVKP